MFSTKSDPRTPSAWAILLSQVWGSHFPVDVRQIASEYSSRFPDPIRAIKEAALDDFEGALMPMKRGGWGILYNPNSTPGRINYTLGHELGHYLCHRLLVPGGFECGASDVLGGPLVSNYKQRELEADRFSSYLLMPLDDFRRQVGSARITLELLRHCADRYGVSLTAAAIKWVESTSQCAAVVFGINGFVSWFRRSAAAERARIFFQPGSELPRESLASRVDRSAGADGVELRGGIWHRRSVREVVIFADRYEMTISLLVFNEDDALPEGWEDETVEDSYDRFTRA